MSAPIAEHCMGKVELTTDITVSEEHIPKLIEAAEIARNMVRALEDNETIPGYIVYEEVEERAVEEDGMPKKALDEEAQEIEELFKGKRVKEFICFELDSYKGNP